VPARCYGHGANEETTARSAAWVCVLALWRNRGLQLADVVGGNGSSDARTSSTGPWPWLHVSPPGGVPNERQTVPFPSRGGRAAPREGSTE
jgi:hypothetical protein